MWSTIAALKGVLRVRLSETKWRLEAAFPIVLAEPVVRRTLFDPAQRLNLGAVTPKEAEEDRKQHAPEIEPGGEVPAEPARCAAILVDAECVHAHGCDLPANHAGPHYVRDMTAAMPHEHGWMPPDGPTDAAD